MRTITKAAVTAAAAAGIAAGAIAAGNPADAATAHYTASVTNQGGNRYDVALRNWSPTSSQGVKDEATVWVDGIDTNRTVVFGSHATVTISARAGHTIMIEVQDRTDVNFDGVNGNHRSNDFTFKTGGPIGNVPASAFYVNAPAT